jgi:cardiolipin synthase
VARVFFLPVLPYLLVNQLWKAAVVGYVVIALTDVADGYMARRRHEESKLGFVLDPFGDILFHLSILVSLSWAGVLSWMTGGLVLARYALLLTGVAVLFLWKGEIWIQPTPFGKATGFAIAALTSLLILVLGLAGEHARILLWSDRALTVLFGAGVLHVLVIGWINFRRPAQGGSGVYRRGWGLLLGRQEPHRQVSKEAARAEAGPADGPEGTGPKGQG